MPKRKLPKSDDRDFRVNAGHAAARKIKPAALCRLDKVPQVPEMLDGDAAAKRHFLNLCEDLFARGLLYEGDIAFIGILACFMSDYEKLRKQLKGKRLITGTGKTARANPLLKEMRDIASAALKYAQAFRLLPIYRYKVDESIASTTVEEGDVFAQMIRETKTVIKKAKK